ncbi:hypothetical protein C7B80_03915 [Cyanosarcina cf. burmensis CCALA 770]|nr:hypothetical protein C7B80_03915 [Cyanosarcina cf. burmensis CCALA 770]
MAIAEDRPSLPKVRLSIRVPDDRSFWRKVLASHELANLICVRYSGSGYWAKDITGQYRFGYTSTKALRYSPVITCKTGGF